MTLGELKRIEANPSAADVPALTAYVRQLIVKLSESQGNVAELQARADRADRLHARVVELTALLNDSARLADHMARLREFDVIADGRS